MKLIINKDRTTIAVGTWGTVNENDYEILDFEFPAELDGYNKRIVYYLGDERVWDAIVNNKAYITNAITTKGDVKAYVWCTKENTEREADTDFRTMLFEMHFYENENADGIVPTPEQVDGFNTMLTAMNEKIAEVNALETTIETAEAQRQEAEASRVSNETTRESNEATRQSNEQTRQTQEADRERRTDEAIGNIEDKTAEYNANAEAKTTAFNNNATQKTNDFNSNYTQKVNDFNTNATSKTNEFNSNASSKTTTFNDNATSKTNTFNSNASSKTTDFNTNAENKTSAFNTNASDKTTAFDNNASSKTSDFNTNAESKTNTFNDNATEKTTAFNTNAQEKIDEYDEHIADYQAQIDELQEEVEELSENMPWNTIEQATEISVDDAAKYSRNKLELFGNTSQDSTTGKNLFDNSVERKNAYPGGDIGGQIAYVNSNATYSYVKCAYLEAGKTYTISWQQNIAPASENGRISRIIDENNINLASFISWLSNSNSISYTPNVSGYLVLATDINSTNIMIEEGSTATDYEPYTGGVPSPNPDYPQDIHVVTGNNSIGVQGKNLFDIDAIKENKVVIADGSFSSNSSWNTSDFVRVDSVNNVVISAIIPTSPVNRVVAFWDKNKQFLNRITENPTWSQEKYSEVINIGNDVAYITLSYRNDKNWTNIQIEAGSTATSYVPYYHQDYPLNLGSLELCKIGNYQDYLYKENGNWYKYGAIEKNVLTDTSGNWTKGSLSNETYSVFQANFAITRYINKTTNIFSDKFIAKINTEIQTLDAEGISTNGGAATTGKPIRISILNSRLSSVDANGFKTWLGTNNVTAYIPLFEPTSTQITDETLISQLEAIYNHLALVKGTNHISVTASDLKPLMELNYMQDLPSKLDNLDSRLALLE